MTGALVTRKKTLSLYCEFLLAGSGFFNVTPRARVTFQLLRCKGKIQLLMQDASVGTVHTVYFSKHKKQMGNFVLNDFCSFAMSIHCRQTRMAQFSTVCTSFSHTLCCWPAQLSWEGEKSAFQGAFKKKRNHKNISWYRLV